MDKYMKENVILSKFCKGYMELKKGLPIRPSEMAVLNIIVQSKERLTPLMIAELLEVSKPMMTAHITALAKKEYIKKEYSKEDKRSFYVIPTEKAKKLAEKDAETAARYLRHLEKELGKDAYESLLSILCDTNKILSKMSEESLKETVESA